MPRKAMPWLRLYVEMMHDPKLRELPVAHRWVWVGVLCAARQSPVPGILLVSEHHPLSERALADLASVPPRDVHRALMAFAAVEMIHRDEATEAWCVTNWASRQFESDDVTARTRRHRRNDNGTTLERSMSVSGNGFGTVSETETETETESSSSSSDSRGMSTACGEVPNETWDAYAEIRLRRNATDVKNPVPWKRSTAINARTELAEQAARWWREYDITPRRLAECLIDGQIRNVQRRAT